MGRGWRLHDKPARSNVSDREAVLHKMGQRLTCEVLSQHRQERGHVRILLLAGCGWRQDVIPAVLGLGEAFRWLGDDDLVGVDVFEWRWERRVGAERMKATKRQRQQRSCGRSCGRGLGDLRGFDYRRSLGRSAGCGRTRLRGRGDDSVAELGLRSGGTGRRGRDSS